MPLYPQHPELCQAHYRSSINIHQMNKYMTMLEPFSYAGSISISPTLAARSSIIPILQKKPRLRVAHTLAWGHVAGRSGILPQQWYVVCPISRFCQMERLGLGALGCQDQGGSETFGWLLRSWPLVLGGVKFQRIPLIQSCRGRGTRMWGGLQAEEQEARDTGHLCGLGLCANTSWAVKFPCRK